MKIALIKFTIAMFISASLLIGCQSTPLTAKEKEAYAKDEAVLSYENQQEANEMEFLSGDGVDGDGQLNP
ncbi:hypothetical protein [Cerasicoccus maritimus]|uniref:hypothetical protein n=1 Tax=Cerasicoccus maritimus TaxID=490089 RepID=UPI0028529C40|nr:hypothetical protein [Cerasicoccus maritimus]